MSNQFQQVAACRLAWNDCWFTRISTREHVGETVDAKFALLFLWAVAIDAVGMEKEARCLL